MRSIAAPVIFLALSTALAPAFAQAPRGGGDGGSAVSARLDRIEEQIARLRGVVAAVETLAKTNGGAGGYQAGGGGASAEQIRQLSEEVAELTQRLQRLEGRRAGDQPQEQNGFASVAPASGFEDKQQLPPLGGQSSESDGRAARSAYGAPPQQSASAAQSPGLRPGAEPGAAQRTAAPPPQGASPKVLIDQAYGALGRREYSAAETYFQQFLDQYPSDLMAGSAQYGSGEAAFQSGEYRTAADRFLKTFTNFPRSDKAPEALLKLAISLRRLGEDAAACDSFAELQRRYPQGPKGIQQRADVERKRANCS